MVQKKLQETLINAIYEFGSIVFIVSLLFMFFIFMSRIAKGEVVAINPEVIYEKDWKVGQTHVIKVDTQEQYGKGTIEIEDSDHNLISKGLMYNTNQTTFIYTQYIPINAKVDRYTINLTLYGNETYKKMFQVNVKQTSIFERAWLFLTTHFDFLEKVNA